MIFTGICYMLQVRTHLSGMNSALNKHRDIKFEENFH